MRRIKQIHWNADKAGLEFGIDPKTIRKRIKACGIDPAFKDRTYSTQQIAAAVYGDLHGEKLRNERLDGDIKELKKAEWERKLVPSAEVSRAWAFHTLATRNIVLNSSTPEDVKQELLKQFESTPILEDFRDTTADADSTSEGPAPIIPPTA